MISSLSSTLKGIFFYLTVRELIIMNIWSFFYQVSPSGSANHPQMWLYIYIYTYGKWLLHFSSMWFCSSPDACRTTWRSVGSARSFVSASLGCGMPCGKTLWRCRGMWRLLMKQKKKWWWKWCHLSLSTKDLICHSPTCFEQSKHLL